MKKLLLFAGTTEGRSLAESLAGADVEILASVATEYGKSLLPASENLRVRVGRLDRAGIAALLEEEKIDCAVDATHPYAVEATAALKAACADRGVPCRRLVREASDTTGCIHVPDMAGAARYLAGTRGGALLTVGSKELEPFTTVEDFQERFYARVLPTADSVAKCASLGFSGNHIIAMQGPFSAAFNCSMLLETGCGFLVTKDSGAAGGFPEKAEGARRAGAAVIVVARKRPETGRTLSEMLDYLREDCLGGKE